MSIQPDLLCVRDIKLAASMILLGAAPRLPDPIQKVTANGGTHSVFWFQNTSMARELMAAWESPIDSYKPNGSTVHELQNQKHPFWFLRAGFRNRERLMDSINKSVPITFVNKADKTLIFTEQPRLNR